MLTATDFCQGHGAECTDYYEIPGDCGGDHGTRSYCDGTCQEAREAFENYLDTEVHQYLPGFRHGDVVLDVRGHGYTPESYRVTFHGTDAATWALAYVTARPGFYFDEVPSAPISRAYTTLLDKLYPTCEHGMDAHNCYGPQHFMSRDQEMAMGW